jgi:hypothetical protein
MSKRPNGSVALNEVDENGDDDPAAHRRYLRFGVAVLLMWWGAWTLADNYLITYSPWSEFAAIGLGAALYVCAGMRAAIAAQSDTAKKSIMGVVNGL